MVDEIVKLCIAAGRSPNIDSIITYNYDNILEESLEKLDLGIPFTPIFHAGVKPRTNTLPIYHVHGYLPPDGRITRKNKLVLSEELYHEQYGDFYHWSNLVQISKFSEKKCLFIGSSFTDPNLRRLLDVANKMRGENTTAHYIFKKKYNEKDVKNSLSKLLVESADSFTDVDIQSIEDDGMALELIKLMEKHESSDARSFGVGIIWINRWDEIPKILKEIREENAG